MESEVTNLAQVKAFDSTDYATAAQGSTADSAVQDTGDETIAGIKTFSSSPIVPAPTTDLQAATKKYVDDNAGGGSLPAGGAEDDLLIKQSATDGDAAWEDSDTHKIRKTYYSATEPAGLADGDIWVDTSVDVSEEIPNISKQVFISVTHTQWGVLTNEEIDRIILPTGKRFELWGIDVSHKDGTPDEDFTVSVYDLTDTTLLGETDESISSVSTAIATSEEASVVQVRVNNATASAQVASIRVVGKII